MIELTHEPIDLQRVMREVSDPHCGAEVLFVGTTRQWTRSASAEVASTVETSHLVYECYEELAVAEMERLIATAKERWPIRQVFVIHRLGRVDPMEASVAIAVSCPHRREAFEAAEWLIDEIKHRVPIWKQEHYVQAGAEWIHPTAGNCRCSAPESPLG